MLVPNVHEYRPSYPCSCARMSPKHFSAPSILLRSKCHEPVVAPPANVSRARRLGPYVGVGATAAASFACPVVAFGDLSIDCSSLTPCVVAFVDARGTGAGASRKPNPPKAGCWTSASCTAFDSGRVVSCVGGGTVADSSFLSAFLPLPDCCCPPSDPRPMTLPSSSSYARLPTSPSSSTFSLLTLSSSAANSCIAATGCAAQSSSFASVSTPKPSLLLALASSNAPTPPRFLALLAPLFAPASPAPSPDPFPVSGPFPRGASPR